MLLLQAECMLVAGRQVCTTVTRPPPHTSLSAASSRRLKLQLSPRVYPLQRRATARRMSRLRVVVRPDSCAMAGRAAALWRVWALQLRVLRGLGWNTAEWMASS